MKIASAFSGHDCSFCVLEDGRPVVHAEYERYIREKEPAGDGVQFMFDEYADFEDIKHFGTIHPVNKLKKYEESHQKINEIVTKNGGKLHVIGHHHAHAANAFYSSNFDKALILTMDGGGIENAEKFATAFTIWTGEGNKLQHVHSFPLTQLNFGGVWTRATRYIFNLQSGWPTGHQAGTVMAMAAMGNPDRFFNDFVHMLTKDAAPASFKPPDQPRGANVGTDPKHPYLHRWRALADENEQNIFDLAAGLQGATEFYLINLMKYILKNHPNHRNLCFAGGVSLNSVAMGKLYEWFDDRIDNIYVTPTPHDGGLTIGVAQYIWHDVLDNPRITWEDNYTPYLGFTYNKNDIMAGLEKNSEKITHRSCSLDEVVNLLDEQNIVAVFGGGSESGRRALGNRSILADPRSPNMKDKINSKVKHRQWFRPFAPSIMREHVSEWFTRDADSPYMSLVLHFKDEVKDRVPAVVHLDGSARLQTVTKNDNKQYYELLSKWNKQTGVPILLNTSFNDREPICETPEHAINCYLKTEIDYLYFYDEEILVSRK